ncbi:MAG: hypothetical protein J6386_22800 [Candidatus Synoicihabitans palmerolidicus]|nr:hypothetical protein [Candidatus Synoicihabitans palmerolidicus]
MPPTVSPGRAVAIAALFLAFQVGAAIIAAGGVAVVNLVQGFSIGESSPPLPYFIFFGNTLATPCKSSAVANACLGVFGLHRKFHQSYCFRSCWSSC